MLMIFRSRPEHKPWLIVVFILLLLAGGIVMTYG